MTGYGREKCEINGYEVSVEIKSVNNRYFDTNIRVPKSMGFLEEKVRSYLMTRMNRGKVDVFVHVKAVAETDLDIKLDKIVAKKYYDVFRELSSYLELPFDVTTMNMGRLPDVLVSSEGETDEEEIMNIVFPALEKATDDIIKMRKTEGKRLEEDVLSRIADLRKTSALIEERLPQSVKDYENRLRDKMTETIGGATFDESRLLTEVAIFSDKVATFEETIRLKSHFDSFTELVKKDAPVGKKLDFIVQEMNREVNTICSKCQDLKITNLGIEAKSQIEAIREQIQNIE